MTQPGGASPHGLAWSVTTRATLWPTAPKAMHAIKKGRLTASILAGEKAVCVCDGCNCHAEREREGEGAYICKCLTHQCWQNESCDDHEDGAAYGILQVSQYFLRPARQFGRRNGIATYYLLITDRLSPFTLAEQPIVDQLDLNAIGWKREKNKEIK